MAARREKRPRAVTRPRTYHCIDTAVRTRYKKYQIINCEFSFTIVFFFKVKYPINRVKQSIEQNSDGYKLLSI